MRLVNSQRRAPVGRLLKGVVRPDMQLTERRLAMLIKSLQAAIVFYALPLQAAIMVYVLFVFFNLVRMRARAPALRDPQTGELVLQFSKFLIWTVGAIAVLGPLAMVVLSFIIPFDSEAQVFVPIVLGLFFGLLDGAMYLYLARRRTRLSGTGLTSEYVFRGPAHMAWEEVEKIKFSLNQQELFLYDRNGRKAQLHVWLVGVKEAVPVLRERLPEAVLRDNQKPLERFFKVVGA
jgi:hypothetical protein